MEIHYKGHATNEFLPPVHNSIVFLEGGNQHENYEASVL